MRQQQRPGRWNNFFELRWYDKILDFIFKLAARSSEVLLAAGVILATANHFQHGELFSTPALDAHGQFIRHGDGSLKMTETILFDFWSWTQAIGFEACSGVVLVTALEARRNGDKVKRNILLLLVIGLSLVGTIMLIMAFIESATGIKERDLPAYYGITMAILRSVVSVAYIMIGRVKHLRFSGPEDPFPNTPDALTQLATLGEKIERVETNTQQRLTQLTERLNSLTKHSPNISMKDQTFAVNGPNNDQTTTENIDEGPNFWSKRTEHLTKYIDGGPNNDQTVTKHGPNALMEDQTFAVNGPNDDQTFSKHSDNTTKHIDGEPNFCSERTKPIGGGPNNDQTSSKHILNTLMENQTPGEDGLEEAKVSGKDESTMLKIRFIEQCLSQWPNMSNKEIQKMATERGINISSPHISNCRKVFHKIKQTTSPEPPEEDEDV